MKVKITSILNMDDRSVEGHALRKHVPRTVCLFLALCLLIGCASAKVEERTAKTSANTVTIDEILSDDGEKDVLANSHFTYDIEYMDLDKEEEADKEDLLLKKTDDELICLDEEDTKFETGVLYPALV